jgi:Zn-dependent protease
MADQKGGPLVSIASVIGGISVVIVAIIAVLAEDQLSVAVWIVAALAIMGIGLGFFASKSSRVSTH